MAKKKKNILVCYNEPIGKYSNYTGKSSVDEHSFNDLSEKGFVEQIDKIVASLEKYYITVNHLPIGCKTEKIIKDLQKLEPDVIFNFVESIEGDANYEPFTAALFELLEYSFTGNTALTLGNCLNKVRTKQIMLGNNIPTPKFITARYKEKFTEKNFTLAFPVILKLIKEDASIGISENSVIYNISDLNKQLRFLYKTYQQNIMIEEFIVGREFNISILGDQTLPISEILFDGLDKHLPKLVTYEAKWAPDSVYYKNTIPNCPANIKSTLENKLNDLALQSYKAMDCRDYARVDFRVNKHGKIFVIEINPNPDISPDSGFIRSAKHAGISYSKVLKKITDFAIERIY